MGTERATTVRQKREGKICALCGRLLPAPHTPGERLCGPCAAERPKTYRVYMEFERLQGKPARSDRPGPENQQAKEGDGWYCRFLEADLKTPLPRRVHLKDRQQVSDLARRGGCDTNLIVQQPFEHALRLGRGGIWLALTEEQYGRLK